MNSSKILFVGKYNKSPKKSGLKQARTSKSKYEDISLGTIMRTSKSRSTTFNKSVYDKRAALDKVRKINLSDNASVISTHKSINNNDVSNKFSTSSMNNYTNRNESIQSKNKKNMISVKKITRESQLLSKKKPIVKPINNLNKTYKSEPYVVSEKSIQKIQKPRNVKKSKNTRNKNSSKHVIKKSVSPKKEKKHIVCPTRRINVYVNPDLYSKINSFFNPQLFIKSTHNFKFFSNFDIHDKYLAAVISDGVMITKYN